MIGCGAFAEAQGLSNLGVFRPYWVWGSGFGVWGSEIRVSMSGVLGYVGLFRGSGKEKAETTKVIEV